jgi:transcriptional regulator with XRE-family HTH domain
MGKYSRLLKKVVGSVEYWTQAAMRRFVLDINARMIAQDLSRADLAKRLGTSPAYVTKAMRGDVNLTLETMTRLALAVGGKLRIEIVDLEVEAPSVPFRLQVEHRGAAARGQRPMRNDVLRLDTSALPANDIDWQVLTGRAA